LEERRSSGKVEENCCWLPANLVGQPATLEVGEEERAGQVFFIMVPATCSSTPGEEVMMGPGKGCWLVADPHDCPAVSASSAQGGLPTPATWAGGARATPHYRRRGEVLTQQRFETNWIISFI
jgi:hypothetical protein